MKQTQRKGLLTPTNNGNPFLIAGSRVMSGNGKMIALVGDHVSEDSTLDPLANQSSTLKTAFEDKMILFGTVFSLTLLTLIVIYCSRELTKLFFSTNSMVFSVGFLANVLRQTTSLLCLFLLCVSGNSSSCVTGSLAQATKEMRAANNLVRNYEGKDNWM